VDVALIALHFAMPDKISLSAAITLGAIAAATAPAATLMVVRQYKAKGPLTSLLLPVVALDDAVGLVIFSVSFGIARALQTGSPDLISIAVNPLIEIVCSLALGSVMSLGLTYFERFFHSRSKRLSLMVTFVFITVGICLQEFELGAVTVGFSPLLTCMMLGTVFCNLCDFSEELMDRCDRWTAPLFVLFFVLSGAELKLSVFADGAIVLIGVLFILFRSAGKYFGSYVSAKGMGCDSNTVKYLGITLLPQAGVALGMSVTAMQLGDGDGGLIRNIVLFAVLIYELVGPLLTKMALTAAGEIKREEKTSARGVK
ncbi:MAG: cation:proton antiporter, partial [Clostridia bacterium]|nr:cation:proton antiporter [Clostridia bacterium]